MIGGLSPFVRPSPAPLSEQRGGEAVRVGRAPNEEARSRDLRDQAHQHGSQRSGAPEPQGTATETARPVPPVQGLLAIGMDGIEALQGIKPETPPKTTDEKPVQTGDRQEAPGELSDEEEKLVRELSRTDQEVRQHERAHAAAGGALAGAPSYTYQQGPDGQRYAVNGEVSIDVSPVQGDPEATIQKMQQVKAAANAPAQPSSQDRSVAAAADAISQQAQAELRAQDLEGTKGVEDVSGAKEVSEGDKPAEAPSGSPVFGAEIENQPGNRPDTQPGNQQSQPQGSSGRDIRPGSFADISV